MPPPLRLLLRLLAASSALQAAAQPPEVLLEAQVPVELVGNVQALLPFRLLRGQEPVDALETFRARHGQSKDWRASLLRQICSQPRVECHRGAPVVFSTAVAAPDGGNLGVLELLEGVEPYDAVFDFGLAHGVQRYARLALLDAICARPPLNSGMCTQSRALVYRQRVQGDGNTVLGELEIYDDAEPADQIHRFMVDQKIPRFAFDQLLQTVCSSSAAECGRSVPVVFSQRITMSDPADGSTRDLGMLHVPYGEEPADVVYAFGQRLGLDRGFRENLVHHVCSNKYVKCRRRSPVVFAAPITVEDGTVVGDFQLQEGEEVADAAYRFAKRVNISDDLRFSLVRTLCGRNNITCTRGYARLRTLPVGDEAGIRLGVIEVFEGQEPADAVFEFVEQHGLTYQDSQKLLDVLCETAVPGVPAPLIDDQEEGEKVRLICNRFAPVIFRVPISAQNGSQLGVLEVLSDEEPADAIAKFGNQHGLSTEEKQSIWTGVCKASGLPCTRSTGIMYQAVYTLPSGAQERLDFYDGVEPTDIIYDYGLMRNLTLQERKLFLFEVCNEPRHRPNCTRAEPMLIKVPVYESADKKLGDVEILEGQEPVDVVYTFMEKHDLFQTAPLNTSLLEVICNSTRVECRRPTPRRTLFSMQATYYGISHTLSYVQPESDWHCEQSQGGQKCVHYVEILSREFCATHMFDWQGCETRILEALRSQLGFYEEGLWRSKNLYAKLGLVRSASREQIDVAYNTLVKRFNNETQPDKYEKLRDAYRVLSDPEEKYYYDLPCVKLFGCLCGKRQKDGGITFTPD